MIRKQMETIAALKPERGMVYVIVGGHRCFLADCDIKIDIKQRSMLVNAIGSLNAQYKNTFASVVFCVDLEHSEHCTMENIVQAENYEITCEFLIGIDETEKLTLNKFVSADVDIFANKWVFEITDQDTVRKLLSFQKTANGNAVI